MMRRLKAAAALAAASSGDVDEDKLKSAIAAAKDARVDAAAIASAEERLKEVSKAKAAKARAEIKSRQAAVQRMESMVRLAGDPSTSGSKSELLHIDVDGLTAAISAAREAGAGGQSLAFCTRVRDEAAASQAARRSVLSNQISEMSALARVTPIGFDFHAMAAAIGEGVKMGVGAGLLHEAESSLEAAREAERARIAIIQKLEGRLKGASDLGPLVKLKLGARTLGGFDEVQFRKETKKTRSDQFVDETGACDALDRLGFVLCTLNGLRAAEGAKPLRIYVEGARDLVVVAEAALVVSRDPPLHGRSAWHLQERGGSRSCAGKGRGGRRMRCVRS